MFKMWCFDNVKVWILEVVLVFCILILWICVRDDNKVRFVGCVCCMCC